MSEQPYHSAQDDRALIQAGYRYALSLTHDQHDADDLIQQACLRLFQSKGRLVGKRYLFVTIRNLYIDRYRQDRRMQAENFVPGTEVADKTANHVQAVDDRMELEHLLSSLRFEERELLYLNCVEGYTAAEIAEITNQPRGTVLSQLARAKKKLVAQRESAEVLKNDK